MSSAASLPRAAGQPKPQSVALPAAALGLAAMLIAVGAFLAGRRDEPLPTAYGRRKGAEAGRSVNGTGVLAELFRSAGHRVTSFSRLSPRLEEYDVIVWVPDRFQPPTAEQRQFLEDWLASDGGRTLIYVGRDYDAALAYWEQVLPDVPPAQADEALRRQAEARAAFEDARSKMPAEEFVGWFTVRRDAPPRHVRQLSGPWAEGIDAAQTDIWLAGRLAIPSQKDVSQDGELPDQFETLLAAGKDPLVFRITDEDWQPEVIEAGVADAQILVVANGSLVLNYPLVNREHRKLAAKLVEECGSPKRVIFLESGPDGPPVLDQEPTGGIPTPLDLFRVWPLNALLLHFTVLGIVLCLARAPLFGRPRELPAESTADFGKHIAALGQLLARTGDRHYAQSRLANYRQLAERKSGRSHRKPQ